MEGRFACSSHRIEHITLLQTQRRNGGQDAFDEAAAVRAIGPEAAFASRHALTHDALACVVRGLDTLLVDKG
jgi:hypothetical protein